eukprot:GHVR01103636.1.p1 GENE.GHVR01103636.1~~GHVR01103636.1.p1  ORF type:complete len:115 (-),score=0.17 GHVR01103636.1:146-490(-)
MQTRRTCNMKFPKPSACCRANSKGRHTLKHWFTALLEPYKDVFAQLFRLCKIAAGCERSFSALKLIKTYLRNTMSDTRLSDLGILNIERELTDAIDLDEFLVTTNVRRFRVSFN